MAMVRFARAYLPCYLLTNTLVRKMILSCKQATRLISERRDRKLDLGSRIALGLHLAICEGCGAVSRQIDFLRRAMRRRATW